MGKNSTHTSQQNGNNKTTQPRSNSNSQLFFNQKQIPPSLPIQKTQEEPVQELNLQTPTEILLAAILNELKTQNMIELLKLKTQQEKEQEELHEAEEMQEQDDARFAEIRKVMYV